MQASTAEHQSESGTMQASTAEHQSESGTIQASSAEHQSESEPLQASTAEHQSESGTMQASTAEHQSESGTMQASTAEHQSESGTMQASTAEHQFESGTMQASTTEHQSESGTMPGWQLGMNLGTCIRVLYDRKLWTDVNFRCKDHDEDERIHAHKVILAARSPVFQAMFFGAFAESKEEVQLADAKKEIFDIFLRYIYSDTVTLEEDTASELLQMAHLYQVPDLVQLCADYLATIIRTENACGILTIALFYKISSLEKACCFFIDQHPQVILNSEGFMNLKEDSLLHILQGDTFNADEEEIFLKAEEWSTKKLTESGLEINGDNIRKTLGGSFYQLRLPTMTYHAMVKCTRNKGYLSAEEYMNITDFINGIPDTSVASNSCVARVPAREILVLNKDDGEETTNHSLFASFDIHVSKDVELISVGMCDIELYLKYDHCKNPGYIEQVNTWETTLDDVFEKYTDKVITLEKPTGRCRYRNRKREVREYDKLSKLNIPKGLYPVLHGCISIGGLNFRHDFRLDTSKTTKGMVVLKQPLKLKSSDKPYSVRIEIKYRCCVPKNCARDYMLQMRFNKNQQYGNVKSKSGHVEVSTQQYHEFIESICFQNCANRNEEL